MTERTIIHYSKVNMMLVICVKEVRNLHDFFANVKSIRKFCFATFL